ncbi:hypothetical protein [Hyphomonas adhaerens]|uniref:Uncharacterized protein n=1 Tax=Hyphomonas adhaerens TaxID=81029 RepID=A0A3B9GWU3_9PROT|nr:hypothetical protein [Hyphomonas adhaerens]HAE26666.1 hypothetical protein [Hyphomonas adhaerens]|tara:strand:- start:3230 stop:3973 length:744 start_codon:yes stop_codon:yes gene_type:complete
MEIGSSSSSTKTGWINQVIRHPITISLYYAAAMVVALVYSTVQSDFNSRIFVWSALGVAVLLFSSILVSALFFRIGRKEEFEDRIADMKEFINAQHMGWIVNDKFIRALEVGSSETWVFTRKLHNDLDQAGEIFQAVRSNLNAGLKYVYFVPDVPSSYDVIDRYRKLHSFKSGQVTFYLVPQEYFAFYTEVVIYNANNPERVGIEWLPQSQLNYYIAMDGEHTDELVGIGRMYAAKFPDYGERFSAA